MFLHPNSLFTTYKGQTTYRAFQPKLWTLVNGAAMSPDGGANGHCLLEDFRQFGGILDSDLSATAGLYVGQAGWYTSYQDTSDTIAQLATNHQGAVAITTAATDNNESWLQAGGAASVSSVISTTAGSNFLQIFDCRVKASVVSDTINWFAGLMEEGSAAANTISDAGAMADKDFIGFKVLEGDGDALKFVYKKAGQTEQVVLTYGTALSAAQETTAEGSDRA